MSHSREIADARFDAEQSARMAQNFERVGKERESDNHMKPSTPFDDMARGLGYTVIFAAVFIGAVVIAAIVFG